MIPRKPIEYHNWGCGRFFKKLVLGMLLHFVVMPARAQWQPGGIPIHNHTGPNDGGQLSNLNVLGYVKTPEIIADTVTFSSSTFDNITVLDNASVGGNLNSGNLTASSATISGNASVGGNLNSGALTASTATISGNASVGGNLNSGNLTASSATISGNASVGGNSFSVGGSTLVVTSGNVGIATDNPSHSLEVNGEVKSDATGGNLIFNADSGYEWWTGAYTDLISYQITHREIASPNNYSTDFAITTAGNVGIGTTSPGAPLEVSGANASGVGLIVDSSATVKQTLSIGAVQVSNTCISAGQCQVSCPANTIALGGGGNDNVAASNPMLYSYPLQSSQGWVVGFTLTTDNVTVYGICARLGP